MSQSAKPQNNVCTEDILTQQAGHVAPPVGGMRSHAAKAGGDALAIKARTRSVEPHHAATAARAASLRLAL